jgi:hypothetical protein
MGTVGVQCCYTHAERLMAFLEEAGVRVLCGPLRGHETNRKYNRMILIDTADAPAIVHGLFLETNIALYLRRIYTGLLNDVLTSETEAIRALAALLLARAASVFPSLLYVRLDCFPNTCLHAAGALLMAAIGAEANINFRPQNASCVAVFMHTSDAACPFHVGVSTDRVIHDAQVAKERCSDSVCRAEYKLCEAFARAKLRPASDAVALDVGAAPGGWSAFLHKSGCAEVIAVDPADLG